jgi:hypothetical protein
VRLLGLVAKWAGMVVIMATALPLLMVAVGAGYLAVSAAVDMAFGIGLGALTLAVWCLYEKERTEDDLFERHGWTDLCDRSGQPEGRHEVDRKRVLR